VLVSFITASQFPFSFFKKYLWLHAPFMIACYFGVKWCREGDDRLPKLGTETT
jgi:hypothetical protein